MKTIILLLLMVSCGKDPNNNPAMDNVKEPQKFVVPAVEMVTVECKVQDACQTPCLNDSISCEDGCANKVPKLNSYDEGICAWHCRNIAQKCYDKEIQIPKSEFDQIMSN